MSVIDARLPELLRGSRPLLGMFCGIPSSALWKRFTALGAKFLPMVITPLIANAFRAAVVMKS